MNTGLGFQQKELLEHGSLMHTQISLGLGDLFKLLASSTILLICLTFFSIVLSSILYGKSVRQNIHAFSTVLTKIIRRAQQGNFILILHEFIVVYQESLKIGKHRRVIYLQIYQIVVCYAPQHAYWYTSINATTSFEYVENMWNHQCA